MMLVGVLRGGYVVRTGNRGNLPVKIVDRGIERRNQPGRVVRRADDIKAEYGNDLANDGMRFGKGTRHRLRVAQKTAEETHGLLSGNEVSLEADAGPMSVKHGARNQGCILRCLISCRAT